MPAFAWNESYSVNIKEIDQQHKKLVSLINELQDALGQGKGKENLASILGSLIEYSRTHFSTEERLLLTSGYPGLLKHKAEHEAFSQKIVEFQGRFLSGQDSLTIQVMEFLKDWLNNHILGTDKKYVPYLISQGIA